MSTATPPADKHYDLFVIGGGSGGVRAARVAAQLGAKVGLAESRYLGGTCVTVGCVPKKLMVFAAGFSQEFLDAGGYGWSFPGGAPRFDWATLIENKNTEVARLNGVYGGILDRAGVTIHHAHARFVDAKTLLVGDERIRADRFLIATGGKAWVPPIRGANLAMTSDQIFYLKEQPRRVTIIGAGYIGMEFAGIFRGLGSEVHVVHTGEHVLNSFDEDVSKFLGEQVRLKGVHLHLSETTERIERAGEELVTTLGSGAQIRSDVVMMATGRRPNTTGLGLEAIGVETLEAGGVRVGDDFQSSVPGIYAIGDVINRVQLTPVALAEAMAFAHNHYGDGREPGARREVDYANIPTTVFSTPNVGSVGRTEQECWHRGDEVDVYESTFRPMKNTLAGNHEKMYMKLIVSRETDRVLGIHVVGPDAGEMMQGFAVAMKMGATKAHFDATIGIHPTLAEELVTMRTRREKH